MLQKFLCAIFVVVSATPGVFGGPNCNFTTSVKCRLKSDNSPCNSLPIGVSGCGKTPVTYTFQYCNNDPTNNITFTTSKCAANMDLQSITSSMNFSRPLQARTCRNLSLEYAADSCRGFYGDIFATGFLGPNPPGSGNGCYDHNYFRTAVCTASAAVDCITNGQEPCNKTRFTASNCTNVTATYYFTYCNLNNDPISGMINLSNLTFGKIDDKLINATDFSILPTQTCRTFQDSATFSTCNNIFSASMRTEGTIANIARYQYCYDYDFIKFNPMIGSDPTYNYTLQWCDITASITCRESSRLQPCNKLVTSPTSCGLTNVTYNFTMCNKLPAGNSISLNANTFYSISGVVTKVVLPTMLNGTKCRTIIESAIIDTCKDILPSQFKVEGKPSNTRKYTYCYAFKFFDIYAA